MRYERFEDLPVWQAAIELAERVFTLTEDKSFACKGDLRGQVQRASLYSPIKGQRYLSDQVRQQDERSKRARAFWTRLEEDHHARLEARETELEAQG